MLWRDLESAAYARRRALSKTPVRKASCTAGLLGRAGWSRRRVVRSHPRGHDPLPLPPPQAWPAGRRAAAGGWIGRVKARTGPYRPAIRGGCCCSTLATRATRRLRPRLGQPWCCGRRVGGLGSEADGRPGLTEERRAAELNEASWSSV